MKAPSTSSLATLLPLLLLSALLSRQAAAFLGSNFHAPLVGQGHHRRHPRQHQFQMTSLELWVDHWKCHPKERPIPAGAVRCYNIKGDVIEPLPLPQIRCDHLDGRLFDEEDKLVGSFIFVKKPEDIKKAISLVGSVDWLLLHFHTEWIQIPCENIIAAAQGSPTRICVMPNKVEDIAGVAFALETGVDALLLDPKDEAMWTEARLVQTRKDASRQMDAGAGAAGEQQEETAGRVLLVPARVTNVVSGGLGDRVCLDLVQLLKEGEGCLVGSSAKALVLVQAEVLATAYINTRPFRVNAGPVHSYVLMADGSAKYLSEVQAGDQVKVVNRQGQARGVPVGRCKIESRPLVKVAFEWGEGGREGGREERKTAQVFLQQAETVRFVGNLEGVSIEDWGDENLLQQGRDRQREGISVTEVCVGDVVLVRARSKGTHLGRTIEAKVEER